MRLSSRGLTGPCNCSRKHGYDATSVQQSVDAADRTKGVFHDYFESKDLLHEIHDPFIDHQFERAHAVLERDAGR
jgi:AcrR family transcriptional regulator